MLRDYSNSYEEKRINIIQDLIPEGPFNSLDIACSIGRFSKILFDKNHSVVALDINRDCIEFAKEKYRDCKKVNFLNCDFNNFIKNNSLTYDFILALEILEHLDDYGKFIYDCNSLLNNKGRLIISTPNRYSPEALIGAYWAMREGKKYLAWDDTHKRIFTSFEVVRLLQKHRFIIRKVVGYHYNSSFLPLLRRKIVAPFISSDRFPLNMFGFNIIIIAEKHNILGDLGLKKNNSTNRMSNRA